MGPSIEDVIGAMPTWAGRTVAVSPINGGLTNRNYRVTVDGTSYFVRIPGVATELLAVDRGNELANTRAAADAGVGARVIAHLPAWNVIVLEWLDARTMSNATLRGPGTPRRIAQSLQRLHRGPRFRDDFDMVALVARYLGVIDSRSIPVPDGYRDHLGAVARIDASLRACPLPTVPCHNDLLAENYLDDGEQLWLIDYEYSGNNDPTFEIGNTAQELEYDDDRLRELIGAYFGEVSPAMLARCRLQMILSDVGWTLWAAIQARISPIDFDFWAWAVQRWTRAETMIDGPEFEAWLDAAEGAPGRT